MQEESHICALQLNPLDSMSPCGAEIEAFVLLHPSIPRGDDPLGWQCLGLLGYTQPAPLAGMAADPQGSKCRRAIICSPHPCHRNHRRHPTSSFNKGKHLVWVNWRVQVHSWDPTCSPLARAMFPAMDHIPSQASVVQQPWEQGHEAPHVQQEGNLKRDLNELSHTALQK